MHKYRTTVEKKTISKKKPPRLAGVQPTTPGRRFAVMVWQRKNGI